MTRDEMLAAWGLPSWFDYQLEALDGEQHTDSAELRTCLYYRTGAGKTYTALALMVQAGVNDILVVAPPAIHERWHKDAAAVGLRVLTMSHSLYRQKGRKFSRLKPVIIDEFHLLGGQGGVGFGRARAHTRGVQAPVVLLSATPNYNDAERVYCIEHILNPMAMPPGGYEGWLFKNCICLPNPHSKLPIIDGFIDGRAAKEHLAELPHVYYVEDPNEDFVIGEVMLPWVLEPAIYDLRTLGLDHRRKRIVASRMEYVSANRKYQLLDDDGRLRSEVYDELAVQAGQASTPVLVFCARAEIAKAAHEAAVAHGARSGLVVFKPNRKYNELELAKFKAGAYDVLFGTATMATGVDGLDKVCDMLILLDDTDDESLRRQVMGRILPRGTSSDVSKKIIVRLVHDVS